jgi:glycosyltransferase involved in cell wall biosynthesis
MEKISIAVTSYNRGEMTGKTARAVLSDPRVEEVLVMDDFSNQDEWVRLLALKQESNKYRVERNEKNVGMSLNKLRAIQSAKSEWVAILDSDNEINSGYIDAMFAVIPWDPNTIYCPEFAAPNFNYKEFAGLVFDKTNVASYIDRPLFDCLLNTCNYLVNKEAYAACYVQNNEVKATDTVWFNYNWLSRGNRMMVVPGATYHHLVHSGSGFMEDVNYNMRKAQEMKDKIKSLR